MTGDLVSRLRDSASLPNVKALLIAARIMLATLVSAVLLRCLAGWVYLCVVCPVLIIPTGVILIKGGMATHK